MLDGRSVTQEGPRKKLLAILLFLTSASSVLFIERYREGGISIAGENF